MKNLFNRNRGLFINDADVTNLATFEESDNTLGVLLKGNMVVAVQTSIDKTHVMHKVKVLEDVLK